MTEGWGGETDPMCYHCGKRHVGQCWLSDHPAPPSPEEKPKFDRVGYMREYMRGWRKRKKAEKESQK
jgi:hypothetical protein